ncbi:hypothetical protein VKT23_015245 [Stygiomarasmius scandens]|uniref:Uncharacterized protein n=1 Tax=Marasmiellus scandens TaxID=2682957 RepID=A0ABR1J1Q4_9AGAR
MPPLPAAVTGDRPVLVSGYHLAGYRPPDVWIPTMACYPPAPPLVHYCHVSILVVLALLIPTPAVFTDHALSPSLCRLRFPSLPLPRPDFCRAASATPACALATSVTDPAFPSGPGPPRLTPDRPVFQIHPFLAVAVYRPASGFPIGSCRSPPASAPAYYSSSGFPIGS